MVLNVEDPQIFTKHFGGPPVEKHFLSLRPLAASHTKFPVKLFHTTSSPSRQACRTGAQTQFHTSTVFWQKIRGPHYFNFNYNWGRRGPHNHIRRARAACLRPLFLSLWATFLYLVSVWPILIRPKQPSSNIWRNLFQFWVSPKRFVLLISHQCKNSHCLLLNVWLIWRSQKS